MNRGAGLSSITKRKSAVKGPTLRVRRLNSVEQSAFDHLTPLCGNKHKALTTLCASYMHGAPPLMKMTMSGKLQAITLLAGQLKRQFPGLGDVQEITTKIERIAAEMGVLMELFPTSSRGVLTVMQPALKRTERAAG